MLGIDSRQAGILADRYLDIVLGDVRGTALLLIQAPLIGIAVAGVWANASGDTLTMYFVLSLAAFFLGAINSCREIVKERALYLREKNFNLSPGAYLVSKFRVQLILIVVQCAVLAGTVHVFVPLQVNVVLIGIVLLAVAFTGTSIGLLISSWVRTPDKAVGMVPLIVIPQILFSDFVLGKNGLTNWTGEAMQLMPVHWGYRLFEELRAVDADWQGLFGAPIALGLFCVIPFLLALMLLKQARY